MERTNIDDGSFTYNGNPVYFRSSNSRVYENRMSTTGVGHYSLLFKILCHVTRECDRPTVPARVASRINILFIFNFHFHFLYPTAPVLAAKPKPSYAPDKHGHKLLNGGQATKRRN